ncbi:N-6 DNA methylase [Jhaorihella thermophila]|nr:N-6 DNA methylase [Jhaorihella thermophila]
MPPAQRKALGQYFTGMRLGRALAHFAVGEKTERVLDPMAGHGDLLDAVHEAAARVGATLSRIDGIEIDPATAEFCEYRLRTLAGPGDAAPRIICGDAFDRRSYEGLGVEPYDLVITNPPYVRYQSLNGRADKVRRGLLAAADELLDGEARAIWTALAAGYSGLADLSVPAWLLSALRVRPGGRLALVVPATWRSRAYGDVIRYLLLRCFAVEIIVEDTQPGWFSDALVRTHLVIARRLSDDDLAVPLSARERWTDARWIQVAPAAADDMSLVGAAFPDVDPEAAFASWVYSGREQRLGIDSRDFSFAAEWAALRGTAGNRPWFAELEPGGRDLPLRATGAASGPPVPEAMLDLLPEEFDGSVLCSLEELGLHVGQGLRTGCNRFFYCRALHESDSATIEVELDAAYGSSVLAVPRDAVRPVLHRQAELEGWRNGHIPATRVLDLRGWILPEDAEAARAAQRSYEIAGIAPPRQMPTALAEFVRRAAAQPLGAGEAAKPVCELSAVRTNVRAARPAAPPRFWYMLPDFTRRHLPHAFVPRIIHGSPQVYRNSEEPIVIDANFSTFWPDDDGWSPGSLAAFLNSAWCKAAMEAVGTPLGGGALKLEAVHLRVMPVPRLSRAAIDEIDTVCAAQQSEERTRQAIDRIILRALLGTTTSAAALDRLAQDLYGRLSDMGAARQRGAA